MENDCISFHLEQIPEVIDKRIVFSRWQATVTKHETKHVTVMSFCRHYLIACLENVGARRGLENESSCLFA